MKKKFFLDKRTLKSISILDENVQIKKSLWFFKSIFTYSDHSINKNVCNVESQLKPKRLRKNNLRERAKIACISRFVEN